MQKKSILILLLLIFLGCSNNKLNKKGQNGDYIILIHGLGRSSRSMSKIENHFSKKGYQVINLDYPSTEYTIEYLAKKFLKKTIEEKCVDKTKKINFITHSMGGIIVRQYLENNKLENMGRVVMLAPPNKGSEVADFLSWTGIMGPALEELQTEKDVLVNRLGKADFDLGVIIGDRSFNWINSIIIPGKDDGKVSIKRAKLDNMKDFEVVDRTHIFIMRSENVIEMAESFIENGKFKNDSN
ncbi:MAG: esterase/lipase family protein [Fusobacteriota bacterium]